MHKLFAAEHDIKPGAAVVVIGYISGGIVRILHAVAKLAPRMLRHQRAHAEIVRIAYQKAVFGQQRGKFFERGNNVLHIAVVIKVIVVNVVYKGYCWAQR